MLREGDALAYAPLESASSVALRDRSLKAQLEVIGIMVPDQKMARLAKERSRLGYHPHARVGWIQLALTSLYWIGSKKHTFQDFRPCDFDRQAYKYGGSMPPEVKRTVAQIGEHYLDIELKVLATYDDPVLEARSAGETCILHLWRRVGAGTPVELIF